MADIKFRTAKRQARHKRVRRRVRGIAAVPRLAVFKSSKHLYAQVIDDAAGRTLASASTLSKELRGEVKDLKPLDAAGKVGELLATRAVGKGIARVVFDRGGFPYEGRLKALADAARAGGLKF